MSNAIKISSYNSNLLFINFELTGILFYFITFKSLSFVQKNQNLGNGK